VAPRPFNNDQWDVKIDQGISDGNTLFGRISRSSATDPNPGNFDGFIGGGGTQVRNTVNSVINDTHIFSTSAGTSTTHPGGGELVFGSIFSSSSDAPGSGAPLADFLMGFPSSTQGTQLLDWSRQRDVYNGRVLPG
jgi:hypothetical protein